MSQRNSKRRILVVGGVDKNIPAWARSAFEIEHFEAEHGRGVAPNSGNSIDAVVVLNAWISHKHYYDARSFAESRKVPCLVSPGGWSKAVRLAAEIGLDWFVAAIDRAKEPLDDNERQEAEEVVESAWREAYEREWAKNQALEKRYTRDRKMFESAINSKTNAKRREEAANRVIAEVRTAAQNQRKHLEDATTEARALVQEITTRNDLLSACLTEHFDELRGLLDRIDKGERVLIEAARMLSNTRSVLQKSIGNLRSRLEASDKATSQTIEPPSFTEDQSG